jgi:ATP-binding cassette subfamily B protein
MMPVMTFVGNLGYVSVAISGCILAAKGTITVGDIQAFISYVKNFTQPITQLAQVSNMMQSMAAGAERVFEFLARMRKHRTRITPCRPIISKAISISACPFRLQSGSACYTRLEL